MPGRIKKKKRKKKKSFALHSYDSERKWRIRDGKERVNRTKKCAKYVRERERERKLVQASDGTEKKTLI